MRAIVAALVAAFFIACPAWAEWKITKDHWSQDDEAGFSRFVQAIGESTCSTPKECFRDASNPYRDSDPPNLTLDGDCADFVYQLRGYYAWKNGLPFGHALAISPREGSAGDMRWNAKGNKIVARRGVLTWRPGFDPAQMLSQLGDHVSSAMFRVAPEFDRGFGTSDFYSPKIAKGSIRPGTAIYDINAHVAIVFRVDPDGTVHYMDSHIDRTLTRGTFGPHIPRDEAQLGSGFKNFRPLKLVDYTKETDGSLSNGKFVYATNEEIPDYSTEQYLGNIENPSGDWKAAKFVVDDTDVGFYDFVRLQLSE
jgi:hypothetical protein